MDRKLTIRELKNSSNSPWDIIIIGGGATGLGIALDAVLRGYKTLLLEKNDFSSGTSSRSTKLVHGGVRYLAQGDVLLVMEALKERGRMLNNAPHLTANQEFIIPVYSIWERLLYTIGLKFYNLLAGSLSLGKPYFIDKKETLSRLPLIKPEGLRGGVVYHDGQFDDARMAIDLARACAENGGAVLNYFIVNGILKTKDGMVNGVRAVDQDSGYEYNFTSRAVINATGVYTDEIQRIDDPGSKKTVRPSQGVHIVLNESFLQSDSAIMIPKTEDGRVLFAIPWYGKVVVGTTDTPIDNISDEPKALDEEVDFIIRTARKYLTKAPSRNDALCIYAGLRPLAADNHNPKSTKEVSRRHKISMSSSGLISITGGKWTSYRMMAEETIEAAIKAGFIENRACKTRTYRLCHETFSGVPERLRIYGDKAHEIVGMIMERPELGSLLHPELPYTTAEIIWICRNEMPLKLEDILSRRTRALMLNLRASQIMAAEVARVMADEHGKNNEWINEQVQAYERLTISYT